MSSPKAIRPLANANEIVQILAANGPLSPSQISDLIGIPRSTVYRLADGLAALGLIEQLPTAHISLTERWLHLADAASHREEWSHASPALDDVHVNTQLTTYLSVPHGREVVCLEWRPGSALNLLMMRPGRTLPLHAGAAGRVMLAYGEFTVTEYLRDEPLRFNERTLTTASALEQDVVETRSRGFVFSDEDVTEGIGAVGVPIFDRAGTAIGSLSIGGLAGEIRERLEELATLMHSAASQVRELNPL
jgi:IclR family acetate operon transcriptional repressor